MPERELVIASLLHAPAVLLWPQLRSVHGFNRELGPWLSFSASKDALERLDRGEANVHAWLFVLGVLPIDRFNVRTAVLDVPRGFVQDATSWLYRRWRHERRLTDVGAGRCTVIDRLQFAPRVPVPAAFVDGLVLRIFEHRHRRLHQAYGGHFIDPDPR